MEIYVVQDYDTVVYAGTNLNTAKSKVKGSGRIDIWCDSKYIGWYQHHSVKGWIRK